MFQPDYNSIADPKTLKVADPDLVDPNLSDANVVVSRSDIVGIAEGEMKLVLLMPTYMLILTSNADPIF